MRGEAYSKVIILLVVALSLVFISFITLDSGSPTSFNVLNTPELAVENQGNQSENQSKAIDTVTGYTVVDTADFGFQWTSLEDLAKTTKPSRSLSLDANNANSPGFVPLFTENASQEQEPTEPAQETPSSIELHSEDSSSASSENPAFSQQETDSALPLFDPLTPVNESAFNLENASINITHDNRNCDTTITIDGTTVGSTTISSFSYDCRVMLSFENMSYLVEFRRSTPRDAYFSIGDIPINLSIGNGAPVDLDHDAQDDVAVTLTYAVTGTANLFFESIPQPVPVEISPAPVEEVLEQEQPVQETLSEEESAEEESAAGTASAPVQTPPSEQAEQGGAEEAVPVDEESPAPVALQSFSQLTLYLILSILTLGIIIAVNYHTIHHTLQIGLKNMQSGNQQDMPGLFQEPFQYEAMPLNELVLKSLITKYIAKYQKLGYTPTAIRKALATKYGDALLDASFAELNKPAEPAEQPLFPGFLKSLQKKQISQPTPQSIPHDSLRLEDLIITYIRKYRREGHTDLQIKEQLLKRYPHEMIDYCFFQA